MRIFAGCIMAMMMFAGCGYTSAAHYAQSVVGESVSTEVLISAEDPQNTVIIKDAVDTAVITKFRTPLTSKNASQTHLKIQIASVIFSPLRYDTNGYVVTYRTTVSMKVNRSTLGKSKEYSTSGMYDFDIEPNAIISDQARFGAISLSAQKAIDAFIAQIVAEGSNSPKE